jgi:hypothetical protein
MKIAVSGLDIWEPSPIAYSALNAPDLASM